ncbi:MAG: histidine kinase N-terminal 7TM domain-containing protein [Anaerolineaceae bacterium]
MLPLLINISSVLEATNQILNAGVAITSISLMLYAFGFNFRDKMARAFALILLCVTFVYTCETIANITTDLAVKQFWLQLKWVALVMLPAAYLYFSHALLTLTGQPSRGRRSTMVVLVFIISFVLAVLIFFGITVGELAAKPAPMPYLERTQVTLFFGIYYIVVMLMSSYNLGRVIIRSTTSTSGRRLMYLFAGAAAPAITAIIFMFHGNTFFARNPDLFWIFSIVGATVTDFFIILMAYVVSFFGVTWTDRAIKSRLFRWLLRGPFVAGAVLGLTTIVRRYGESLGDPYSPYVPIVMIASILLLEYGITLAAPGIENVLFFGDDREDLSVIRALENRMLTRKDLNQFLETVAASICDRLQASGTFIAVLKNGVVDYVINAGMKQALHDLPLDLDLTDQVRHSVPDKNGFFRWGNTCILPLQVLTENGQVILLGLCGFSVDEAKQLEDEQLEAVHTLADRASTAMKDRLLQKQAIDSIAAIQSEVEYIQQLRGQSGYSTNQIFEPTKTEVDPRMIDAVKDALTHYWGGPKFTNNPLLSLDVVKAESVAHDGNQVNGLRSVLKNAIERTKPEGERKYTGDWLLYNILDMKFLQGKKVREVARKLSVSEADLYRKQRVALENVTVIIQQMEGEHNHSSDDQAPT